jgi:hypothetical protein
MTLDLAAIPADIIEASTNSDHASQPASGPAAEPALETAAEPASPIPDSASTPLPQAVTAQPQTSQELPAASYPNDHFIHALYGGFMGMPDLPGALLRDNLWDSFLDAYTNPEFSHHFAHIAFPAA